MFANGLNNSQNNSHKSNNNSYALQDSSHHSSGSDRQMGRFYLSLTRTVSLEQRLPEPCACNAATAAPHCGSAAAGTGLDAVAPARPAAVAAADGSNASGAGVTKITDSFVIELPEAAAAAGQAAGERSIRRSADRSQRGFNAGSGAATVVAAGSPAAVAGGPALSSKGKRLMRSGHLFSLSALNVFGVYIGEPDHLLRWVREI
jgi:hypothetical protein